MVGIYQCLQRCTVGLKSRVWTVPLLLLLLLGDSSGCGPGRGAFSTRRQRKTTPLVFKQHVPNVPENNLGASGVAEGKITRTDPKFKSLVINHNPEIVFKDDEGTGADRIMTQRCKERLNVLAVAVKNRWPGVRLRVVEAFDEGRPASPDSLHYEGRAVDLTTSDRDRSKYGMLARMAVDAGFDWVYYESRTHIHCSVRSESSLASKYGGCFSGSATVITENGLRISMSELSVGDRVLTADQDGSLQYSEVVAFLHRDVTQTEEFYSIRSEDGHDLTVTPNHLIFEAASTDDVATSSEYEKKQRDLATLEWSKPTFAGNIRVGTSLLAVNETADVLHAVKVVNVSKVVKRGVYAPLTSHGTIVVDGLVSSCYASFSSQSFAHAAMLPLRYAHNIIGLFASHDTTLTTPSGVHWYARFLFQFKDLLSSDELWYKSDATT